jgi:hypothetical protein
VMQFFLCDLNKKIHMASEFILDMCATDRLVAGIVGSNPAQGMDVCPLSFCVVLSCVGRGLATG